MLPSNNHTALRLVTRLGQVVTVLAFVCSASWLLGATPSWAGPVIGC